MTVTAPALLQRSDVRLAAAGVAALAAVYLGFIGLEVATAERLIRAAGYPYLFLTFVLWLAALWRWGRERPAEEFGRRELLWAGLAIAGFSVLAIASEPFQAKVINDEYVLQSTAFNLHYYREAAAMVRGYDILGAFVSTDSYLDKRPYFYPFLVSLVHDLTGYRTLNAHLLNAALLPAALGLAWALGRRLGGARGGLLAVVALGSLPLLGQNATGAGMELLNFTMLALAILLAADYLRTPTESSLAALLLTTVLLAQSRYESALYVGPAGLVMLLGWWRVRRVILPWAGVLVPLLLLPCALQNQVVNSNPVLWELREGAATRFSLSYFPGNLRAAGAFLFSWNQKLANSWMLSAVGLAGFAAAAGWWLRRRPGIDAWPPAALAVACFALGIIGNTLLVWCYYWSAFNDLLASRFALPLHLLLALAVVVLGTIAWRGRAVVAGVLFAAFLVYTAGVSTGRYGYNHYSYLGAEEIAWEQRFVRSLPAGHRLVISNKSALPWVIRKWSSIRIDRARLMTDRIRYHLGLDTFADVLVLQSLRPASPEGFHEVVPEDRVPDSYHLELLAERRFGTRLCRISRLVAIDPPPAATGGAAGSAP